MSNYETIFARRSVRQYDQSSLTAAELADVESALSGVKQLPGKVTVQANGRGVGKLLAGKMQKIDLGIILKYVELALVHEGKTVLSITPKENGKNFAVEVSYGE